MVKQRSLTDSENDFSDITLPVQENMGIYLFNYGKGLYRKKSENKSSKKSIFTEIGNAPALELSVQDTDTYSSNVVKFQG